MTDYCTAHNLPVRIIFSDAAGTHRECDTCFLELQLAMATPDEREMLRKTAQRAVERAEEQMRKYTYDDTVGAFLGPQGREQWDRLHATHTAEAARMRRRLEELS
jgi:hypothetical protein